jgi:hypothetical protein
MLPANFISSLVVTIQIPPGQSMPKGGVYVKYARVGGVNDGEALKRFARPAGERFPGIESLDLDM